MKVEETKDEEKMLDAQGEDEEMKFIGLLREAEVPDMFVNQLNEVSEL